MKAAQAGFGFDNLGGFRFWLSNARPEPRWSTVHEHHTATLSSLGIRAGATICCKMVRGSRGLAPSLSLSLFLLFLFPSHIHPNTSLSLARAHARAHAHALLQVAVSEEDEELGFDLARGQLAGAQPAQERGFAGTALGSSSSRSLEGRAKPPAKNVPGDDPGMEVHGAPSAAAAAQTDETGWACLCCTFVNTDDTAGKCGACEATRSAQL